MDCGRRCTLKRLIEKDFAQPPKFDLANELNCRPNYVQEEHQPASICITSKSQVSPGDRGLPDFVLGTSARTARPSGVSGLGGARSPRSCTPFPLTPQACSVPRMSWKSSPGRGDRLPRTPGGPGLPRAPAGAPHVRGAPVSALQSWWGPGRGASAAPSSLPSPGTVSSSPRLPLPWFSPKEPMTSLFPAARG